MSTVFSSRRVAPVAAVALGLAASASGVAAVTGHDIRIDASGTLTTDQAGVWNVLHSALVMGVCASWLAWLVLQVPRYRHATGERRQQLKWLYSGAAVFVVAVFCAALVSGSTSGLAAAQQSDQPRSATWRSWPASRSRC